MLRQRASSFPVKTRPADGSRGAFAKKSLRCTNTQHATRSISPNTQYAIRNTFTSAFTLMELILVMTVLAVAVWIAAPALANFFRGRTLDSEARRFLSLTRHGQSRAVAEGVPMELWLDDAHQT